MLIRSLFYWFLLLVCASCAKADDTTTSTTTAPLSPTFTVASSPQPTPVGQSGGWDLLFSDDFDGTSLDTAKWNTCYWWDNNGCTISHNNELEWYQPDDVSVTNGTLKLQAQQRLVQASDGNTYNYTSGMVTTGRNVSDTSEPAKFTFTFGYAEIRAKIPKGQGLWPAFWLLPTNHNSKPEIDVMEILGHETDTVHFHYHYLNSDGVQELQTNKWTGPDFSTDWHTFAVDWQPDKIVWYVDGVERYRYTDTGYIPNGPMYLLLNLAIGGDWPGPPDSSTPFPSYYDIDYVRVWRRSDQIYLLPSADTYTNIDSPSTAFGQDNTIQADHEPIKTIYLKFDTTALAGKQIASAQLRVKTILDSGAGSSDTQNVQLVNNTTWPENTLTFNNAPPVSTTQIGVISNTVPNTAYNIPLESSILQPKIGGMLSLAIQGIGADGLYLYSKENDFDRPYLVINLLAKNVFIPIIFK